MPSASDPIRTLRRGSIRWGLFGLTGLLSLTLLLFKGSDMLAQQRAAGNLVMHTQDVLLQTARLESHLHTALEAAEPRGAASLQVTADLAALRALSADTPRQQQELARLEQLFAARTAPAPESTQPSAKTSSLIADSLARVNAEETRLLAERRLALYAARRVTMLGVAAGGALLAVSAFCCLALICTGRHNRRHNEQLRRLNQTLEQRVEVRTAELCASEAQQRRVLDHVSFATIILATRPDGRYVYDYMNLACSQLHGQPPAHFIGRTLQEIWPQPFAEQLERRLDRIDTQREPFHEMIARPGDGQVRCVDGTLVPLPRRDGQRREVLVCVSDVTEREQLEQQLRLRTAELIEQAERQAAAAERESAMFRNSPDLTYVVGVTANGGRLSFRFETISPACAALTGRLPHELVGRDPADCLPPEVAAAMLASFREAARSGETSTFVVTHGPAASRRDHEGSTTPVQQPGSGHITHLAGCLRDVTERNRLQEALHHGQKIQAIGRLAAGVAHDFNNILQIISGSLELTQAEVGVGTPGHQALSLGMHSVRRGSYLTHHLLAYARQQILLPVEIDLGELLSSVELLLARTLGSHVELSVRCDPGIARVQADAGQLETALLNLAINASHAILERGRLSIEAGPAVEDGADWARIVVTDTGSGMDAATLAQAIEPFFTTKGVNGSGLGLSMVHGFAEQSGGKFRLRSTPGIGTSAELLLPARIGTPAARHVPPARMPPSQGGRILLVDDNEDILVTVAAFLEKSGFAVARASNANAALAVLQTHEPVEAIITDYAMPGMNGVDLLTEARLLRPDLPAVVISGLAAAVDAAQLERNTLVLSKPFDRQTLVATIRQLQDNVGQHVPPYGTRVTG